MKFRKKPVVIEARLWRQEDAGIEQWLDDGGCDWSTAGGSLFLHTLEGIMECQVGDWVVKGVKGEFYPIKDAILWLTYDAVDGQS